MSGYETFLIVVAWMVAGGSPGPATLAISGTSMEQGRKPGLTIAFGILCGSASWGIAAALGMSALMMANAWMFEAIRYVGAAYLLFLAVKSLRNVMRPPKPQTAKTHRGKLFLKGMLLHITNPKAILAWGAIYAIALPEGAAAALVWSLFVVLIGASATVFLGYAVMFSSHRVSNGYIRLRRWFDLVFAALFGAASLKILTARLEV